METQNSNNTVKQPTYLEATVGLMDWREGEGAHLPRGCCRAYGLGGGGGMCARMYSYHFCKHLEVKNSLW